jgi:hypothetical protein
MSKHWYLIHANIVTLTAWLADNGRDAKTVAYAVEKPWKFEDEWEEAREEAAEAEGNRPYAGEFD